MEDAEEAWAEWLRRGLDEGRFRVRGDAGEDDLDVALERLALDDRADRIASIGTLYDTYDEAMADWISPRKAKKEEV